MTAKNCTFTICVICTCSEKRSNWLVMKIRVFALSSSISSNWTSNTTTGDAGQISEQLCRLLESCLSFRLITNGLQTTLSECSCSSKQTKLTRNSEFPSYWLVLGGRHMPCLEIFPHHRSRVRRGSKNSPHPLGPFWTKTSGHCWTLSLPS